VKFIVIRLLTNSPDPDTGRRASATEVLGDAIEEASYFEEREVRLVQRTLSLMKLLSTRAHA